MEAFCTCASSLVLPAETTGEASTDVGGSRRVRCRLRPGTTGCPGLVKSMHGVEHQVYVFDWCIQKRHKGIARRSHAARHRLAITHLAAIRAILWARHAHGRRYLHFGRHVHYGEMHRAGLNNRQAHPCRHEDSEQDNKNAFGQVVHHNPQV